MLLFIWFFGIFFTLRNSHIRQFFIELLFCAKKVSLLFINVDKNKKKCYRYNFEKSLLKSIARLNRLSDKLDIRLISLLIRFLPKLRWWGQDIYTNWSTMERLMNAHPGRSAWNHFPAAGKACPAGRGDNSRRVRAVYLGLARDYELDKNF